MNKRTFIKNASAIFTIPYINWEDQTPTLIDAYYDEGDDKKWQEIRKDYKLQAHINLENGYYCITPQPILQKYIDHINYVNNLGSMYMRTEQINSKAKSRDALAELLGCSNEELVITRNTTESLNLIISGLDWAHEDEAVMSNQDYGAMLDMFRQISKRHGTVNRYIDIPNHPANDEEIVALYEKAITPKTKIIMVCHMINITGQILPIKKICDMAHSKGVLVLVDGAHCVGHFEYRLDDLGCDFYGSSLHKWLSNPLGAGILYVKKDHIDRIWPIHASSEKNPKAINRLNHTGTLPVYTDRVILDSIAYLKSIGLKEKEDRLRYLQNYWKEKLWGIDNLIINTPKEKHRSCGIGNIGVKGMTPIDLSQLLYKKYNVYTVAIDSPGVKGCRITPNVYTTTKELDVFVAAMKEIAKGAP